MRFTAFLADRKISIICFTLIMLFISMIIYLDGSVRVNIGNIIYINLVSFSFYVVYLTVSYFHHRNYYLNLLKIALGKEDEIINRLPRPKSHEQSLFQGVLSALYNEHNSKVEGLQEQKKEYEEFITSWVHEIKTPIAVSRLLIESNSNTPRKETLYSLEEELDKIENYIEQVLYYSKTDDFSKDYLINETQLDRVVKDAVKKQVKTFINKKINIEIDNTGLGVITDRKWLSFILDQVLSNALKYTSPGGKIKIYGKTDERLQRLIIEDNGIGIRPEDLERVFDKGFTGYNGRENSKSTGVGLYLSKKLARKLGHDIAIESKYGEYTKVTIIFPKLSDYLQVSKEQG